ncbi:MAG: hypothetical protein ACP5T9_03625, partial [Thermoplasmata archaeon]
AQHYEEVVGEVYSFKSTLANALSLHLFPNQLYITLSLGVQTFPIFIPPTEGEISILPFSTSVNYLNVSIPTSAGTQTVSSGFSFYVSLYDHEYPAEEVLFDNGIIATGHMSDPVSKLNVISNGTASISGSSFTIVLFNDIGNSASYTSAGAVGISILVTSISSNTYSISGAVKIKVSSPLSIFWADYIKSLAPSNVQVTQYQGTYTISISGMSTVTVILLTMVTSINEGG